MKTLLKIILIFVCDWYIGLNGGGRWKLSLFETLCIAFIVNLIILL